MSTRSTAASVAVLAALLAAPCFAAGGTGVVPGPAGEAVAPAPAPTPRAAIGWNEMEAARRAARDRAQVLRRHAVERELRQPRAK